MKTLLASIFLILLASTVNADENLATGRIDIHVDSPGGGTRLISMPFSVREDAEHGTYVRIDSGEGNYIGSIFYKDGKVTFSGSSHDEMIWGMVENVKKFYKEFNK